MLSGYARIYVGNFSFKSVNKFLYNNKSIAKIFAFRSEVLYWLHTWGTWWSNNTNSVNPKNTDNFTFMKQSFCDTGEGLF